MRLDLTSFAIKWQQTQLTEKSAYQQHFRDLCEALGVPHPTEEDVVGTNYTFEKHVTKVGGGSGFADVWRRDAFAWEYKLPGGDLNKAYKQLNEYHEDLGNPPLLVVCDFKRFEVHTKFDSQRSRVYSFDLEELRKNQPVPTSAVLPQDVLRYVFGDRNLLRPEAVTERVTRDAATDLLKLAQQLELERALAPHAESKEQIAHFLMRIVFCLFADSIGLIPNNVFRKLVEASRVSRLMFNKQLPQLFEAMSGEEGYFGPEIIPWFNGGLFNGSETIELNTADCAILRTAAKRDWSQIEPSIFGTLFERSLDAAKRSMIGAHYTSPEDILLLVEPVVMTPLRREWAATQTAIEEALAAEEGDVQRRKLRANRPANKLLTEWAAGLSKVRILDPACGSGNFLYIAMKQMLDLWEEARAFGLKRGLVLPVESMPTPAQLYGIEIDFYAHEIASAVVWIGLLQWKRDHSYNDQPRPILERLDNIEHADAIMRYDESARSEEYPRGKPYEPKWPRANYIVGNPPFLGGQDMKGEMDDAYVNDLRALFKSRVPGSADLVLFWFEKSRVLVNSGEVNRVGLIATQSVRGGANRRVLQAIVDTGNIFWAISDRKWARPNGPGDSKVAMVQVSMIAFDNGEEATRILDGSEVGRIPANLKSGIDTTKRQALPANKNLAFQGPVKVGKFEVSAKTAESFLGVKNVNGASNAAVLMPWMNGHDVKYRPKGRYIINFGNMSENEAAQYEQPFAYVSKKVRPFREKNKNPERKTYWWRHGRSGAKLQRARTGLSRVIVTTRHSKHRIFLWADANLLPDSALVTIVRDDDYFFGVLHSRAHEVWARSQGTQVRDVKSGFRYTPNSTFETYPFPWQPGTEPAESESSLVFDIAEAARELVELRNVWLNPVDEEDRPIPEEKLKERTLTKLYDAKLAWLTNAHRALDEAVFAAYGWPASLTDQEILARLLALNHERAGVGLKATGLGKV